MQVGDTWHRHRIGGRLIPEIYEMGRTTTTGGRQVTTTTGRQVTYSISVKNIGMSALLVKTVLGVVGGQLLLPGTSFFHFHFIHSTSSPSPSPSA